MYHAGATPGPRGSAVALLPPPPPAAAAADPSDSRCPSLLQLVVCQQVQRPTGNRSFAPRRAPAAPVQQAQRGAGWPLAAVRADQATETADSAAIELIAEITGGVDQAHAAALQRSAATAMEALSGGGAASDESLQLKQKVRWRRQSGGGPRAGRGLLFAPPKCRPSEPGKVRRGIFST